MGANTTLQDQITEDNARITGTQKHCMAQTSILVGGVAYTPAQVIAIYQNDLDGMAAVAAAKLALADARAKAAPAKTTRTTFDRGFKRAIEGAYDNSPATLGDFGIAIATPKTPSIEVKALALAKAEATRALRHTMGKKQKAKLSAQAATTPSVSPTPPAVSSGTGGTPPNL